MKIIDAEKFVQCLEEIHNPGALKHQELIDAIVKAVETASVDKTNWLTPDPGTERR